MNSALNCCFDKLILFRQEIFHSCSFGDRGKPLAVKLSISVQRLKYCFSFLAG